MHQFAQVVPVAWSDRVGPNPWRASPPAAAHHGDGGRGAPLLLCLGGARRPSRPGVPRGGRPVVHGGDQRSRVRPRDRHGPVGIVGLRHRPGRRSRSADLPVDPEPLLRQRRQRWSRRLVAADRSRHQPARRQRPRGHDGGRRHRHDRQRHDRRRELPRRLGAGGSLPSGRDQQLRHRDRAGLCGPVVGAGGASERRPDRVAAGDGVPQSVHAECDPRAARDARSPHELGRLVADRQHRGDRAVRCRRGRRGVPVHVGRARGCRTPGRRLGFPADGGAGGRRPLLCGGVALGLRRLRRHVRPDLPELPRHALGEPVRRRGGGRHDQPGDGCERHRHRGDHRVLRLVGRVLDGSAVPGRARCRRCRVRPGSLQPEPRLDGLGPRDVR